ncbi:MAG: hypothetical protein GY852_07625 [bacterium]|nr:hypothetical protein [bacterium]
MMGTSFAEECQACQDTCHALAETSACNAMDSDDDRGVYGGICAFQCKVIYSREGRCPGGQELWSDACGNVQEEDKCWGIDCMDYCDGDTSYQGGECIPNEMDCKFHNIVECEKGCDGRSGRCIGEGSQPVPGNRCHGVSCGNNCEGMISYYEGECEPSSGECLYASEECEFACNPSTGLCERNVEPPEIILETTPDSVVISGKEEVDIMVQLVRSTGEAVEGAEVYIRVSDPKHTGLLGDWGFMDVKKYSDGGGIASATLGLPGMKSIDRMHYEEFPLELEVEITAAKHSEGEDWSATKTGTILVKSPVPEITGMSISPDPAQAYFIHMLRIEVKDEDEGPKNLKYTIRCFGGKLGTHSGEAANSDEYSRVFHSGETSEGIEWTGPAQGVDDMDPVAFKAKMANLEGLSKNLGANRLGIVGGIYKAANGLNGNAQNLATGFHSVTQSESWREGAYHSLDLGLEGFKTFVGVYTLGFKAAPGMLGKLSNDAGDLVDAGIGHMQANLKGLAHRARVNAAETRITEYACAAIVEDSDGYVDWHLFQFDLEYEGFESDKQYGKDDEISG